MPLLLLLLLLLLASVVTGCSGRGTAEGVEPLARAEGWRDALVDHLESGTYTILEIAYDRATAQRAWAENVPDGLPEGSRALDRDGRYGSLDDVDLATHVLVVWSGGSTSCPGWLYGVDTDDGVVRATTRERVEGNGCADIFVAYRMVLAVERGLLPDAASLPARLVIDGRDFGSRALVTAYPAGS